MIPKVRVWNYKKKEMSYNVLAIDFVNKWAEIDYAMYPIKYSFNDIESMLPTGTRDKNGEFIFEGDIVLFDNIPCKVIWENSKAMFAIIGENVWWTLEHSDQNLEVIGNIYENPELLEVK